MDSMPAPASTPIMSTKPIHCLVVDTGPIIMNDPPVSTLLAQADELFTIPSVLSEIRDQATRMRVETTLRPFLTLRSPKPGSIKFVSDFARRTGDLQVLSQPDLHLLALTYELECERNGGDWRLRKTPTQKGVNGKSPAAVAAEAQATAEAETGGEAEAEAEVGAGQGEAPKDTTSATDEEPKEPSSQTPVAHEQLPHLEEGVEALSITQPEQMERQQGDGPEQPGGASEETKEAADAAREETETAESEGEGEESGRERDSFEDGHGDDDDGDDGGEWITPSNLKKHQAKEKGGTPVRPIEKRLQAALLTSDFAMQNVALRINLNLLSPAMARITQVRTWVLRCHGCFAVTRLMDKQFCPSCGQATLTRTSCSTDASGQFRVHLKRNYQYNKRGNVYSVPKAVHGSASGKLTDKSRGNSTGGQGGWGRELILSEDQNEYVKKTDQQRRARIRDLMDEEYLPNILTGARNGPGGRRIRVGAGHNVNAKKKR